MTDITFNVTEFRVMFPAFPDNETYSDSVLNQYFTTSSCFISTNDYGYLKGDCRKQALYLMTAHIAAISTLVSAGESPTVVQSSTVDKISVSLVPPPVKSLFQHWLMSTPYGQQLYALLQIKAAGGWSIGGLPERDAFRKVYGVF